MTVESALTDMNNAVLDLQTANFNTWPDPMKRLASVVNSEKLKPFADELVKDQDLDAFVANNSKGRGIGRERADWPVELEERLGLSIAIINRAAENPHWFENFCFSFFFSGTKIMEGVRAATNAIILPFNRDFASFVRSKVGVRAGAPTQSNFVSNKVFVVHGHDGEAKEATARVLEKLGLDAIILHEQSSEGRTIVEKLEHYSDVGFAVVLLTPDDLGRAKDATELKPRARQNVLLELGYFVGLLGRNRVCALRRTDVEIPSDYDGVVYTDYDNAGRWRYDLARELKAAGYDIDLNKI